MEIPQKSCFSLRGWAWRSNFKAFSIGKVHLFFTETWFFYQNKKKKAQLGGTPRFFFLTGMALKIFMSPKKAQQLCQQF